MGLTGRWTDKEKGEGYWQSLRGVEAIVDAAHETLKALRVPDIAISLSSANPSQNVSSLGSSPKRVGEYWGSSTSQDWSPGG
jgi:hypothetical protein